MNKVSAKFAAFFLVLLLAGCFPKSQSPITDAGKAVIDTRLNGVWTAVIENELTYIHFLAKDGNMTDILMVNFRDKGKGSGEWLLFSMFPSRIGDTNYMNIKFVMNQKSVDQDEIRDTEEGKNYFLMRYGISDDGKLSVWTMEESEIEAAIERGLKGTIRRGKFFDDVLITASQDELVKFIGESDAEKIFGNHFGTFQRLQ